jgi:hypothetical protein
MQNLRTRIAITFVALVAFAGCGGSSSKPTDPVTVPLVVETVAADPSDPVETQADTEVSQTDVAESTPVDSVAVGDSSASPELGDEDAIAASVAKAFSNNSDLSLNEEQSQCMAKSILATFSTDELKDIGKTGFDALSDADKARAVGSFKNCPGILEGAILAGFKQSAPDLDDTQGRCAAAALGNAFSPEEMVALSTNKDSATQPETMKKIFTAFNECDGLLATLIASGMKSSGASPEQAACAAKNIVKDLGVDGMVAISGNGATPSEEIKTKITESMKPCLAL